MDDPHLSRLIKMYEGAAINQFFKPTLKLERGKSEIHMTIDPKFYHAAGAVHGAVFFKMLDDAAFFAVNSLIEDAFVVTAQFNIYYFQPLFSGNVIARGRLLQESKSSFLAESWLEDESGKQLARGTGTFVKSKFELKNLPSYNQVGI